MPVTDRTFMDGYDSRNASGDYANAGNTEALAEKVSIDTMIDTFKPSAGATPVACLGYALVMMELGAADVKRAIRGLKAKRRLDEDDEVMLDELAKQEKGIARNIAILEKARDLLPPEERGR